MNRQIFLNLPVKDLPRSMNFFKHLGFTFEPKFTDDTAACLIVSEDIFVMLLTETKFASFIDRPVSDARKQTEVITCLSCSTREEVDRLLSLAYEVGGRSFHPAIDLGEMYARSFNDLDGHIWEFVYASPSFNPHPSEG